MKIRQTNTTASGESGTALAMVILSVTALGALATAMISVSLSSRLEQGAELRASQANYVCQAGLSQAMYRMSCGQSGTLGTATQPVAWGGGRFWVSAIDLGGNLTRLTASGLENGTGTSQELVVRAVPNTMWRFAMFGKESMHMDSNARADSYDSSLGTYASQVSGSGSDAHGHTNGDIGSNGGITLDSNAKVWGDATPGPSHSVVLHDNAVVTGSTAPNNSLVEFPSINVPTYTSYGNVVVNSNTTIPAGNRTYGTVRIKNTKTLTLTGPGEIVISNLQMDSNCFLKVDDTNGPVTVYVIDNFILDSNSNMFALSKNPANLRLNLLSDNVINPEINVQLDTVSISSNSSIYGVVYAPNARITLDSNFSLYGSLMARALDVDSNSFFHYDEHLGSALSSGGVTYETVAWREVPFQH